MGPQLDFGQDALNVAITRKKVRWVLDADLRGFFDNLSKDWLLKFVQAARHRAGIVLLRCIKTLRPGDTLTVWKLDRLGRSLRDLITMLDDFRDRCVTFRSLTEQIDSHTPTGRAMWQMIGVLAELERSMISERTKAGVVSARARGVKFGRKPKLTRQQIAQPGPPSHLQALLPDTHNLRLEHVEDTPNLISMRGGRRIGTWIRNSYLVREFAENALSARSKISMVPF